MIEYAINVFAAADPAAAAALHVVKITVDQVNGFMGMFSKFCKDWKVEFAAAVSAADKESLLQLWTNNKWEESLGKAGFDMVWEQLKLINERMLQAKEALRVVEWFASIIERPAVDDSQWPRNYEEKCDSILSAPVRSGRGRRAARLNKPTPEEKKAVQLMAEVSSGGRFNMLNYFLTPQLGETFPCLTNKNLLQVHPNNSTVPATVVIMFRSLLNLLEAQLADPASPEAAMIAHFIHPATIKQYTDLAGQILISCGFDVKMCIIKEEVFINATLPDKQIAIWQIMNSCARFDTSGAHTTPFYETVDDMVTYQRPKAKKKDAAAYKIAFTSYVDSVTELAGILRKISLLGPA